MTRGLLVVAAVLSGASCLDAAQGRARRDLGVGQAEADGARVSVADGLAAVRAFAPGSVALWAQAPALSFRLSAGAAGPWTIAVENALTDAALTARLSDGAPLPLTPESAPYPTEKRWSLAIPTAGLDIDLTLAPPDAALAGPWRFAVFADVQEQIHRVGDIFDRMNLDPAIRFCLITGDLTKYGRPAELAQFQQAMKRLAVPCYATLGNHELATRVDDSFHDHFGRGSFRFVFRGVQLTLLDSASATLAPAVYDWLDVWLAEGAALPHVVLMHIPPLDPIGTRGGAFASRAEASKLLALLAAGDVDLTIYGHIHSYYAFSNAGIPAFISGGGGAYPEAFDGIGRHYLTIDVDPATGITQTAMVPVDR